MQLLLCCFHLQNSPFQGLRCRSCWGAVTIGPVYLPLHRCRQSTSTRSQHASNSSLCLNFSCGFICPLVFQGSFNSVFLQGLGKAKKQKAQKGLIPLPSNLDKAVPKLQVIHGPVLTPGSLRSSMASLWTC